MPANSLLQNCCAGRFRARDAHRTGVRFPHLPDPKSTRTRPPRYVLQRPVRRVSAQILALVFAFLACVVGAALAAPVGEVESVRGPGVVQRGGKVARLLGKGLLLEEGDVVTTGPDGTAVLRMTDGTRITVRPNSKFQVQSYEFDASGSAAAKPGSMVINLFKGGMRTLTGAIPKRGIDAARIVTATATIGIRGTDFDVRLCTADDCPRSPEDERGESRARPLASPVAARVLVGAGSLVAIAHDGTRRLLATGGPLYAGDTIESAADAHAVVAFRDHTRITLQPATRVRIDDFVYDRANPDEGRFRLSLVKGALRAFTGLIGKANPKHAVFRTPTATIGIRGTGFDYCIDCDGDTPDTGAGADPGNADAAPGSSANAAGNANTTTATGDASGNTGGNTSGNTGGNTNGKASGNTSAFVWDGEIELTPTAETCPADPRSTLAVPAGAAARVLVATCAVEAVAPANAPRFDTPRPDSVEYDADKLWAASPLPADVEGLYVFVRDGHVSISTATETLHLGRNEAGYAGGERVLRLDLLPQPLRGGFVSGALADLLARTSVAMMCMR